MEKCRVRRGIKERERGECTRVFGRWKLKTVIKIVMRPFVFARLVVYAHIAIICDRLHVYMHLRASILVRLSFRVPTGRSRLRFPRHSGEISGISAVENVAG